MKTRRDHGRGRTRRARAFTLLEVMISASLLVVGLGGVLSAMTTYEEVRKRQRVLGQGLFVAESSLERALNEQPVDGCEDVDADMQPVPPGPGQPATVFRVCRKFTAIGTLPNARMLEVLVTWGGGHRVRLASVHVS